MVEQVQKVVFLQLHFTCHTLPTAGAAFQIGHTHDVVKRHPQSQPASGFSAGRESLRVLRVSKCLSLHHSLKTLYIQVRIGTALVIAQTAVAQCGEFTHIGG